MPTPIAKKEKIALTGDDCREGLTAVLSVKVPDPKFSSQTKDKLVSSEVRPVVENVLNEALAAWFEEHPAEAKVIVGKVIEAAAAREAARKARELTAQESRSDRLAARQARRLPGEAIPPNPNCSSSRATRPAAAPSRAATANSRRCCRCAARSSTSSASRFDKMLGSRADRHADHRARHRHRRDDFIVDKLRYHKIIVMTDADVDGAHIRTLLLTFFYRQMRELIDRGHLYIAQPPLYKVTRGKSEQYLKDERALEDYLIDDRARRLRASSLASGEERAGRDLRRWSRTPASSAACCTICTAAITAR